ncbi:class I SAM-dependent methyltransferase [Methylobacterium sp. 190mf]|uniref:class I SAM-dependent methyltransferase n=1 Tax=Methylobacterium sp. 190mf TaxID=1761798 RepID=UPI0015E3AFC0|nr:class I SAM-dependent methyltransferase [Methylobacterium sp. 190mf]
MDFEKVVADGYLWLRGTDPGELMIRWQAENIEPKTIDEVRSRLMPTRTASAPDINAYLHSARSALLREVPKGVHTFLSAGCAGLWFFDWIEKCYGRPAIHIGLEYYTPKPEGLPQNVRWIENTCSDMAGVASASCDLVFSGQNYEHLWPDELLGFMLEAARVTKEGGLLVMDSPNRTATELLKSWSHPEHTVEATLGEAEQVMTLAGFDVTARKGIWLMRDPATEQLLPLPPIDTAEWSVTERSIVAKDRPEHSFIWWLEGRRSLRVPDERALADLIHQIFDRAWPERLTRFSSNVGRLEHRDGEDWIVAEAGESGAMLFGPYLPLRKGKFECEFQFELYGDSNATVDAECDVMIGRLDAPISTYQISGRPGRNSVTLCFVLDQLEFGVQFRFVSWGTRRVACRRKISLIEER